jgi:hypothetical protein
MSASINSVQTRTMAHHFPIRAGQPDIQFTVQFASNDDKHKFQDFVRDHQRNTQVADYTPGSTPTSRGAVTLMWPERDIMNWTGYIVTIPIREARFEYAPRVTFGIALIDSLMSESTTAASIGSSFWTIAGAQIPTYVPFNPETDFQLPTPPASQQPELDQARSFMGRIFDSLGNLLNS